MQARVDLKRVEETGPLFLDDEEDRRLVEELDGRARGYLGTCPFVRGVRRCQWAAGIPGKVGLFACEIEPAGEGVGEWIWVVVGDLPPACIRAEGNPRPGQALHCYLSEMWQWVGAVRSGRPIDDLVPVNVEPTCEWAEALAGRLNFIDSRVLEYIRADLNEQ